MPEEETERQYREQGKPDERELVICPKCSRSVPLDNTALPSGSAASPGRARLVEGEALECPACHTRFAAEDTVTVTEHNATRFLVHSLESPVPAERGLTAQQRWAATGGIVTGAVVLAVVFGGVGAAIGFGAICVLWVVSMSRAGGGYLR